VYETSLGEKTLEAGKLYRVTKNDMTPSAIAYITDPAQARKGDLALDDGTFLANSYFTAADGGFSTLSTDEQSALRSRVRGIVFWTESESGNATLATDKVLAADFPHCTHGLIVSLTDVSAGTKWQSSPKSVSTWQAGNATYAPGSSDYQSIATADYSSTSQINTILGYQQTKLLKAYNATLPSGSAYTVLPVLLLETFSTTHPAPLHTTGWFLPSVKELHLLCYKDVESVSDNHTPEENSIDHLLEALGGNRFGEVYWSSTERDFYLEWVVVFSEASVSDNGDKEENELSVRAVCAF